MSSFSLIMIIGFLIVIVILLIVAISLLNKKDQSKTNKKKNNLSSKHITLPNIDSTVFHPGIEKLGTGELTGIVKKIYDSYKCFDFKNMDASTYSKKEWHTWQVSLLLMLYKKNEEFFISNQKSFFHDSLLNSNEDSLKSLMKDIIKKYNNYIDVNSTKDTLCREYIWSYKDVSVIFYFLANYKRYKK